MNAILDSTENSVAEVISVTVGAIRSAGRDEIVLVYMSDGQEEPLVVRYDQLPGVCRHLVGTVATDPLGVIDRSVRARAGFASVA